MILHHIDSGASVQSDEVNDSVQTEPTEVDGVTDTELKSEAVVDLEASNLGEEVVQPSALPPHSTRECLFILRSEKERHRPGKYSYYKVSYFGNLSLH